MSSIEESVFRRALEQAVKIVRENIDYYGDLYPAPASVEGVFPKMDNTEWTSSFWNGLLWQCYRYTEDSLFRDCAASKLNDFKRRIEQRISTNTHDLGFLYTLSCKAQYLLTGSPEALDVCIKAADLLMERYCSKAGIIQAWGDLDNPDEKGRMIIDCLMNITFLFWVGEKTGNRVYHEAAERHLRNTQRYIIRDDDTTYHTYYFDTETGEALYGKTAQGYSDDSCWARGQAWGIYGLSLNYKYVNDDSVLRDAKRLADYFLNHLPSDGVCYWDLAFTSGEEERDSSAAAIAACGLLELSDLLPVNDSDRSRYRSEALRIMVSLCNGYVNRDCVPGCGILEHSVYSKPAGNGVDEFSTWGDYFFVECLMRLLGFTSIFW